MNEMKKDFASKNDLKNKMCGQQKKIFKIKVFRSTKKE